MARNFASPIKARPIAWTKISTNRLGLNRGGMTPRKHFNTCFKKPCWLLFYGYHWPLRSDRPSCANACASNAANLRFLGFLHPKFCVQYADPDACMNTCRPCHPGNNQYPIVWRLLRSAAHDQSGSFFNSSSPYRPVGRRLALTPLFFNPNKQRRSRNSLSSPCYACLFSTEFCGKNWHFLTINKNPPWKTECTDVDLVRRND